MYRKMGIFFACVAHLLLAQPGLNSIPYTNRYVERFDKSWDLKHDEFMVHSIPKCGTHFIQKVVQLMTPHDIWNTSIENFAQHITPNVILRLHHVYTPQAMQMVRSLNFKTIAMTRDPRDALISHVFYMRSFKGKANAATKRDFYTVGPEFDLISLEDQITSLIVGNDYAPSYLDYYKERLGWSLNPRNLKVKYEDLASNDGGGNDQVREKTVLAIANFINMKLSPSHLAFILREMGAPARQEVHEGKIFQRASTENWKVFLNETQKMLVKEKIGEELIRLGYEKDLNW